MATHITRFMQNPEIFHELGARVRAHRLNCNITQAHLAQEVGVNRMAIVSLEKTGQCTLDTLLRVMRGLNMVENLDVLFPVIPPSPILMAKMAGKMRKNARSKKREVQP